MAMRNAQQPMLALLVACSGALVLGHWALAFAEGLSDLRVGSEGQARWTETTINAAKTPDEQAALQQGQVATVTGEIVDVSCYLQLNKRGPGHIACGAGCIRQGMPIGLLTPDEHLYLVIPEEHDPRRGGLVSLREFFADRVGQTATVTGLLVTRQGYRTLFIAGAPLTPPPTASETQGR